MMLKIQEVAERLKISERSVRGLIARGELKSYRIRSCRRVSQEDLESYLEECRVDNTRLPKSENRHF